jgi:hypothetical protein
VRFKLYVFVFIISDCISRYAEEVIGCFRFMVFYFLSLATFFVTGLGIILVIVSIICGVLRTVHNESMMQFVNRILQQLRGWSS